jgi:RHS repeat-associated protein
VNVSGYQDHDRLVSDFRYFDPYGNTRGTAQPAWPEGEKGFIGGAGDTATGLTDLGAREYQPGTGLFISPDPLLKPYDPQDLNAYAYAADNPATNSDPSGAMMITGGSTGCVGSAQAVQACNSKAQAEETQSNGPKGQSHPPSDPPGTGSRMICNAGICASVDYQLHHPRPAPVTRPQTSGKPEFSCGGPYPNFKGWAGVCHAAAAHSKKPFPWQALGIAGLTLLNILQAGGDPVTDAAELGELGDLTGGEVDEVEEEAATCGGESFTASTKVLLASGATIPIAALKPGDKVLATNVKTGKTQAETVAAVLVHHDTNLYDLTIKAGHRTAVIHTTASHLFWDTTTRQWVKAANLRPGDHLRTPSGGSATVAGGHIPEQTAGWMWDLTIPGDHDFYIDTAATTILAHNCPAGPGGESPKVSDILKGKLGSIMRAPLPSGSPAWSDIMDMTMEEVRAAARSNQPGFKTILKLRTLSGTASAPRVVRDADRS